MTIIVASNNPNRRASPGEGMAEEAGSAFIGSHSIHWQRGLDYSRAPASAKRKSRFMQNVGIESGF
jgi:hypothetical protein